MADNVVTGPLSSKKAAALRIKGDAGGASLFRRPKLWEIDQTATGDSWCD